MEDMVEMEGGHAQARAPMTLGQQNRAVQKAAFVAALREDGTLGATCKRTGLPASTIYRWRKNDPEFNLACEEWLHVELEDQIFESLYQIILKGPTDPKYANAAVRAGEFLLKALNPELYADRIKVEATVTINAQVGVILQARDQFRAQQEDKIRELQELRTLDMSMS